MKIYAILITCSLSFIGCAGNSSFVDTGKLPDSYQCNYMKDVCKEAQDFEAKYEAMNSEEKKEFKSLLFTYRKQCNDALKQCLKSDTSSKK